MERILLEENKQQQNAAVADVRRYADKVNAAIKEFITDTGYCPSINELTNEDTLKVSLDAFVEKFLDSQNVTAKIMRANAKVGFTEAVELFCNKIKTINYSGTFLESLILKDDYLCLEESEEERIRESFRVYISSETALSLYQKHMDLSNQLTAFGKLLQQTLQPAQFKFYFAPGNLFLFDTDQANVLPVKLNYEKMGFKN